MAGTPRPRSSIIIIVFIAFVVIVYQTTAASIPHKDSAADHGEAGHQAMTYDELDLADLSLPPEVITEALFNQVDLLQDQLEQCEETVRDNLKGDDAPETEGIELETDEDDAGDVEEEGQEREEEGNDDDDDDEGDVLSRQIAQLAVNAFGSNTSDFTDHEDVDTSTTLELSRTKETVDEGHLSGGDGNDTMADTETDTGVGESKAGTDVAHHDEASDDGGEKVNDLFDDNEDVSHVDEDNRQDDDNHEVENNENGEDERNSNLVPGEKSTEKSEDSQQRSDGVVEETESKNTEGQAVEESNDDDHEEHQQNNIEEQIDHENREESNAQTQDNTNAIDTAGTETHDSETEMDTTDSDTEEAQAKPEEADITNTVNNNNDNDKDTINQDSKEPTSQDMPQNQKAAQDQPTDNKITNMLTSHSDTGPSQDEIENSKTTNVTSSDSDTSLFQDISNVTTSEVGLNSAQSSGQTVAPQAQDPEESPNLQDMDNSIEKRRSKRSVSLNQIIMADMVEGGNDADDNDIGKVILGKGRIRRQVSQQRQVMSWLLDHSRDVKEIIPVENQDGALRPDPVQLEESLLMSHQNQGLESHPSDLPNKNPSWDIPEGATDAINDATNAEKQRRGKTENVLKMAEKFLETQNLQTIRPDEHLEVARLMATLRNPSRHARIRTRRSVSEKMSPERYVPLIDQLVERLKYLQHSLRVCHMLLPHDHILKQLHSPSVPA